MTVRERFERVRQGRRNRFSLRTRLTLVVTLEMLVCILVAYGIDVLLNNVFSVGWHVPLEFELLGTCLLIGILVTGLLSRYFFNPIKKRIQAHREAKKLERQVYAVFNKDRFLANLEPNRRIGDDIIAGTMYIVATDENRFPVSLTDEQISKYALRFWNVETFDDIDVVEANLNLMFSRFLIDENL